MTGMVGSGSKVTEASQREDAFIAPRFHLVFTARCAETIHIPGITVVEFVRARVGAFYHSMQRR